MNRRRFLCTAALTGLTPPILSQEEARRLETFLLLPEPKVMRNPRSMVLGGALDTVLSPAREIERSPGIETYGATDFERLGLSPETFSQRARKAADQLLGSLQPEWIYDDQKQLRYAVYRGDRPIHACLLAAPSLSVIYEQAFGEEIWVALPDRHALYVFPAGEQHIAEFTPDLSERFETDPYAASSEIFSFKKGRRDPLAVGSFVS